MGIESSKSGSSTVVGCLADSFEMVGADTVSMDTASGTYMVDVQPRRYVALPQTEGVGVRVDRAPACVAEHPVTSHLVDGAGEQPAPSITSKGAVGNEVVEALFSGPVHLEDGFTFCVASSEYAHVVSIARPALLSSRRLGAAINTAGFRN